MSTKRSPEHKRFTWRTIAGAVAATGAFIAAAIATRTNAFDMLHAKIADTPMLVSDSGTESPDMSGLMEHASQFVMDQANRSLLVSMGIGVLAIVGLSVAAKVAHTRDRLRIQQEQEDDGLCFRDQPAPRQHHRAVLDMCATVLSRAVRRYDDVADPTMYAILDHGGPASLGNGVYRSIHSADAYGPLEYTGDGTTATNTVAALGPIATEWRTAGGNYFFADTPRFEPGYYQSYAFADAA